jgi:hypothetical protein
MLFACVLVAGCGAVIPTRAQDLDTVSIAGRVVDQNGAIIADASITAVLNKTRLSRTVKLDSEGRYRIGQLEPGIYTLRVSAIGFARDGDGPGN